MTLSATLILWSSCTCRWGDTGEPDTGTFDSDPATDSVHTGGTGGTGETGETGETGQPPQRPQRNVLFILSDDIGVDASACYDEVGNVKADQPTIQALCDEGIVFDHVTSYPSCSPTRATILTGRYGFRNGVTEPLDREGVSPEIDFDELTLPQVLDAAGNHTHANLGKWHLSRSEDDPNTMGWGHFEGVIMGEVSDYFAWHKTTNGTTEKTTTYATTENVDDTLRWIEDQEGNWFVWLAFNAAHTPYHLPPADLHGATELSGDESEIEAFPEPYFKAMVESMDSEIGRLLDSIDPDTMANTWVVYLGDNGTAYEVNGDAFREAHSKATLYQGGIHVPMVITGPDLVDGGRRVPHMIDTVDLFPTMLELAGVDWQAAVPADTVIDGVSFVSYLEDPAAESLQDWAFAEVSGPRTEARNGGYAYLDERWKLVVHLDDTEELYDLQGTYEEGLDLIGATKTLAKDEQAAYDKLKGDLDALLASQ